MLVATTRGFLGRRKERDPRLPPGQYDVGAGWPVLTAEATPRVDAEKWSVTVDGLVDTPRTWSLRELRLLPPSVYAGDIHCVTTWSKLDTNFTGISVDTLFAAVGVRPEATFIVETSTTGYTTNLPLAEISDGKAWIVWSHEGKPLSREHGGPVRLLVPRLYFWKSAKWVTRISLRDHDEQGFWERNGYHDLGDPWLEQRYQGD